MHRVTTLGFPLEPLSALGSALGLSCRLTLPHPACCGAADDGRPPPLSRPMGRGSLGSHGPPHGGPSSGQAMGSGPLERGPFVRDRSFSNRQWPPEDPGGAARQPGPEYGPADDDYVDGLVRPGRAKEEEMLSAPGPGPVPGPAPYADRLAKRRRTVSPSPALVPGSSYSGAGSEVTASSGGRDAEDVAGPPSVGLPAGQQQQQQLLQVSPPPVQQQAQSQPAAQGQTQQLPQHVQLQLQMLQQLQQQQQVQIPAQAQLQAQAQRLVVAASGAGAGPRAGGAQSSGSGQSGQQGPVQVSVPLPPPIEVYAKGVSKEGQLVEVHGTFYAGERAGVHAQRGRKEAAESSPPEDTAKVETRSWGHLLYCA